MSLYIMKRGTERDNLRKRDPYLDRRSGEDRRQVYSLPYFNNGGVERRGDSERRQAKERRKDCTQIGSWTSVCLDSL